MKLTAKCLMLLFVFTAMGLLSCDKADDTMVQVRLNGVTFDDGDDFNGDVDGDFTGNGGSDSRTFVWLNNLSTAEYNADITSTTEGSFKMTVLDADGNIVLERSLYGGMEPDSFSGVTQSGTSGLWTVTIEVESFNGDGSFSLSAGD